MNKIIFLYASLAFAIFVSPRGAYPFNLPAQLSNEDIPVMVEVLGYPTSTKFLSNPFPLGGYSGFEIGVTSEFIDTTDLAQLGDGASQKTSIQYNSLSIGKGLYYNIDIFVNFVPFANSTNISDYGGILKWNFYQGKYLPFSFSLLGHINTINIQDSFLNETKGWDFLGGFNLSKAAFYLGGGQQYARSTFSKNILDTTDPQIQSAMSADGTLVTRNERLHTFAGVQVLIDPIFFVVQINRYDQPVYSAKLGVRF